MGIFGLLMQEIHLGCHSCPTHAGLQQYPRLGCCKIRKMMVFEHSHLASLAVSSIDSNPSIVQRAGEQIISYILCLSQICILRKPIWKSLVV